MCDNIDLINITRAKKLIIFIYSNKWCTILMSAFTNYIECKEDKEDVVLLDNIIMQKVCTLRNGDKIETLDCDIAYKLYILGNCVNIFTREIVPQVHKERIMLCKEFNDCFSDYKFDIENIVKSLRNYLDCDGVGVYKKEILELRK